MKIWQIRVGIDNFSYLVQCESTGKAALVDPGSNASESMKMIGKYNMDLLFIINTHYHRDHNAENSRVAETYRCGIIASVIESAFIPGVTRTIADGEVAMVGDVKLEFILTPGHTPGGMCILVDDVALLTGDTLFIGDCGRTDLAEGSDQDMFNTLQRLRSLPDDLIVYPGHDYGDIPYDSLGNQKKRNKVFLADNLVN